MLIGSGRLILPPPLLPFQGFYAVRLPLHHPLFPPLTRETFVRSFFFHSFFLLPCPVSLECAPRFKMRPCFGKRLLFNFCELPPSLPKEGGAFPSFLRYFLQPFVFASFFSVILAFCDRSDIFISFPPFFLLFIFLETGPPMERPPLLVCPFVPP